jgi:RimJ/RimL family protein N-acetyltransferase
MSEATLETERLILRMMREDDLEEYAKIYADPEVVRYLGEGRTLDRTGAWWHMAMVLGHWALRGYGPWAVEERASGRLVGRVGFLNPEGWPGFELGWVLAREHWGKGYATEAGRRALAHAFERMGRDHVISLIHPDNANSIRVAERLGERLEARTPLFGREVFVYGIGREAWRAAQTRPAHERG